MAASSHAAHFRLVRLQREELIVQCKKDDYEVWGAPDLTLAEYQAEEMLQRQTTHSQRGLIVWGLVLRDPLRANGVFGDELDMTDDDVVAGQDAIVCHCESHQFDCLLRKSNGDVVRGSSFHVNAVYTLPTYRKRGLAKFLLREVSRQLSRLENAVASVLFSDIGPSFYERLGWDTHRSTVATIDVAASRKLAAQVVQVDAAPIFANVAPLFLNEELDELLSHEHSRIEDALLQHDGPTHQEVFAALPTRECLEWQFCSGVLHAYVRHYGATPSQCGAKVAHDDGDHAFVLWTHDLRASILYIVYSSIPGDDPIVAALLLREALAEADRFGLRAMIVWDPPAALAHPHVTRHASVSFGDRSDALSSLMLFKHVRDDPNSDVRPKWIHNERFAWV